MKQPWSDLPNAQYIDWVLKSLKENPKLWEQAFVMFRGQGARDAAVRSAAAAVIAAAAAWRKVWGAVWGEESASSTASSAVAWDALLALIAYDDCDQYLAMSFEKLKMYAILTEKPQAVLLLPVTYVQEKLNETALV